MDHSAEHAALRAELQARADPERAKGEKAYLKSELNFHGVRVPQLRTMVKAWLRAHKDASMNDITALARRLWETNWHEERSLAIRLLMGRSKDLTVAHLPQIEEMMSTVNTWSHLDDIAIRLVGTLIENDPTTLNHLPRWADSENFWVRRTAILAQMLQFRRARRRLCTVRAYCRTHVR